MTDFAEFIKDKPGCFSTRQGLLADLNACDTCKSRHDCFSMQLAVLDAVNAKKLSNSYVRSDRNQYRATHSAFCDRHGIDSFKQFDLSIVTPFHDRVYPPQSMEKIQSDHELEDMFDSIESSHLPKALPVTALPSTAAPCVMIDKAVAQPPPQATIPTTTTAPTVARVPISATKYTFLLPPTRGYSSHTNADLVNALKNLIHAAFDAFPAKGYMAIREEFCAIHIEMNHRQQHAPRFRNPHSLMHVPTTDAEIFEALDRQVIDLHWRAFSYDKPSVTANNYPTLFNNTPFDLAASEKFAQEEWSATAKSVHLHLTEEMQWEHAIIQSEEISKRWLDIHRGANKGKLIMKKGAPHIECQLHNAIRQINKPQMAHNVPGMVVAWMARKIVGEGAAKIAQMAAIMTGEKKRDTSAMRRTLESLDQCLGIPKTLK